MTSQRLLLHHIVLRAWSDGSAVILPVSDIGGRDLLSACLALEAMRDPTTHPTYILKLVVGLHGELVRTLPLKTSPQQQLTGPHADGYV